MIELSAQSAFTAVVDHYAPLVRARCERELGGADADDVVQAVFVVLWRRWGDAPGEGPALSSWLYRTTGHVLSRAYRDRSRRRRAEQQAPKPESATMEEHNTLEHAEARRLLDAALSELPSKEREAVVLSQLAGHSYADVAAHQRCSKATVASRVQQGMNSLRRTLQRRGCVLSLAGLAALMSAEAQASVPLELAERINRLPAACTTGTTAGVLSANIIRWSRTEIPLMKIIGSTCAAGLCAVALLVWHGHATANNAAEPTSAADSTVASTGANAVDDLDALVKSLSSQTVACFRWSDPKSTWARLRATSLGAMIPAAAVEEIEKAIAGIERVEFIADPLSLFGPDSEITKQQKRSMAVMQGKGPNEAKAYAREVFEKIAAGETLVGATEIEQQNMPKIGGALAYLATIRITCADSDVSERVLAWISEQSGELVKEQRAGGFTVLGTNAKLIVEKREKSVVVQVIPDGAKGELVWAEAIPWPNPRDVQGRMLLKPDDPKAYAAVMHRDVQEIIPSGDFEWWIEDGRFRMSASSPSFSESLAESYASSAKLTGTEWNWVPRGALLAGACATRSEDFVTTGFIQGLIGGLVMPLTMLGGHQADAPELMRSLLDLTDSSNGDLIGYLEVAGMMPLATVALSAPAERSQALLNTLAKCFALTINPDSTITLPAGYMTITLGHQNGHLVCTTDPVGLASFTTHDGQFQAEPDVALGLSAGGSEPALTRFILRTEKIIDLVLPLAPALGLPQEEITALQEAAVKIREDHEGGWFVVRTNRAGMHAEAGGAVALVPAAALALKTGFMPTGVN
jgi:RNA polymerase sigma-70 factor, ECF subfamily